MLSEEMRHYCTYFDRNYLGRGLALHQSLMTHAQPFQLHILCFDDFTFSYLSRRRLPNVHPIALAKFEKGDEPLLSAKANRSRVEYYFTCTPSLPLFLMRQMPEADMITYLDADLYFFRDPEPMFEELGSRSILIIGHRFPESLRHMEASNGIYNVGWVTFRSDAAGRQCLQWWRQQCLEWCSDKVEKGQFGDQKYLDDWPTRFPNVVVSRIPGANVAPWNVGRFRIECDAAGAALIDSNPLLFYHFHNLRLLGPRLFYPGLDYYLAPINTALRTRIYAPYLKALLKLMRDAQVDLKYNVRESRLKNAIELFKFLVFQRSFFVIGSSAWIIHLEPFFRPLLALQRLLKGTPKPEPLSKAA